MLSESASKTFLWQRRQLMIPLKGWNKAEATGSRHNTDIETL